MYRELGSRDHIPDDIGPMQIGVGTVASIVREFELACSEIARGSHLGETVSHRKWGTRIRTTASIDLRAAHHVPLPFAACMTYRVRHPGSAAIRMARSNSRSDGVRISGTFRLQRRLERQFRDVNGSRFANL